MSNANDMSTPVTRGELRDELQRFRQEFREEMQQLLSETLARELAKLATKTELEMWGGALLARIEAGEQRLERGFTERIEHAKRELQADLARHTKAYHEATLSMLATMDEKYADLPGRVNRLETAVFTPERR